MKICITILLAAVLCLGLFACAGEPYEPTEQIPTTTTETTQPMPDAPFAPINASEVAHISITTLPGDLRLHREYYSPENITWVVDYINSLEFEGIYELDTVYLGMGWVIKITFHDDISMTYHHFGNLFFSEEGGPRWRMTYEQASLFEGLIQANPSDTGA